MFVMLGIGSCIIPKRFIFCFVGILASTLAVSLNTNFSMAIVSMEEKRNVSHISYKYSNECLSNERPTVNLIPSVKKIHNHKKFKWSPETEGQILGAVYYGQLFGFLPGGRLAEIYGGKRTLIIFLAVSSFCTALIPITARLSVYALIACRFLIGFATAPVLPILFYLISRWIPYSERSFTSSFVLAGYGLGAFLSFITSGVLCASDFLGGWPAVFYTGG
ncbi:putative inorganic phosphate cotransporter, partial [Stegodyphus mimosarum]